MSELDSYRRFVERLAVLESTEVFSNAQSAHAQVILETFFKFAKNNVVIFCHKLSEIVYGNQSLINAADSALNRCVSVRILTQKEPESELLTAALKKWKEDGKHVVFKTALKESFESETPYNFAVMDGKAYRFEPAKEDHTAFACMNGTELAQDLLSLFDKLDARAA
jgi:GH15 family glucan-1,4-alpha-glucosidase